MHKKEKFSSRDGEKSCPRERIYHRSPISKVFPKSEHSSGKKSPCLAGAYNKRFCINYYFTRIKNFFQYIHAIIWYMYVMSVVHACNEIIAGLHEKNQSLPFEKSDGSDFFIERLRQIYQKALILDRVFRFRFTRLGIIPILGWLIRNEVPTLTYLPLWMWQRIPLIVSAVTSACHIAMRFWNPISTINN